jgi:hypothetical protein
MPSTVSFIVKSSFYEVGIFPFFSFKAALKQAFVDDYLTVDLTE